MAQAKLGVRLRGEDQTDRRILTAAAERFAGHGYAATSIRDLARDVGVTVGAIYVHFPSKERLLVAVYEEGVERIGRAVDTAIDTAGKPWDNLAAAAGAHLEVLLSNAAFARVMVRVIPADVPEAARDLRRLRDGYEVRFARLVDALDLAPGTDRTLLRLMLLGALNATQIWHRRGAGRADAATIARQFIATLQRGAVRPEA
jgi:TetR/AcrR family transcriptional regulator, cholesterol catabolism regulator